MATKHEKRNVLTLWGHRGWHAPDDDDYNTGSLNRGYRGLNQAIQEIAEHVTIHSVSHSNAVIPIHGMTHLIYMSVSIVYSGYLDVRHVSHAKVDRTVKPDETVYELFL